MFLETQKKQNQDDIGEASSPSKRVVPLVQDLAHDENSTNLLDLNKKVDDAVNASAAQEAQMHGLVDTQADETDSAEEDDSDTTEQSTPQTHESARPPADVAHQDVFSPSTSPQNASVAIPVRYDVPQLVGVTVSTVGTEVAQGVSLADLGVILRRNRRTVAFIILLVSALAALALSQVTPRYTAVTKILVGAHLSANQGAENILSGFPDDEASIQSQVAVLTSTDLALRVIEQLGLGRNPDFAPDPETSEQAVAGGISPAAIETINKYSERLRVEHLPNTRVITVSFSAADPAVASGTANTIVDLYIQDQRAAKFGAIDDMVRWLSSQVIELRRKVVESELAIENFKLEIGIIDGNGTTLSDQEIASLNVQLIESRTQTMEAQTRFRQIRNLLATPEGIDSAAEVLDSNLIQRLRQQESVLLAELAELGAELGEKHPRMLQMQAEADQVQQKIDQEMAKIVKALEYQYNIARSREQAIASGLSSATGQLAVSADAMVRLNAMEREAAPDRLLLGTMLGKLKQASNQIDMSAQEPDARIISHALSPIEPSFPMTRGIMALTVIGSALLAIMFVLVREFTDRTIRSARQMAEKLNVTSFGIVPRTSKRQRKGLTPFQYAVEKPRSRYAQAARAIAQKIQTIGLSGNGSTIMTTASQHEEGKSDLALALAIALMAQGHTVMLIDADHFYPQLHSLIDAPIAPGLIDILNRRVNIKDVVYAANSRTPFAFMPIGDRDLLSNGGPDYTALDETLTIVKQHFDYIIINGPPMLISNDALVLGRLADASVIAVRWGKTHRRTAKVCAEKLAQAGCQTIGGVLTDVDLSKYELYEYGQSGSCTSAVDGCYAN